MAPPCLWPTNTSIAATLALGRPLKDLTIRQQQRVMTLVGHWLALPRDALDSIWHAMCTKQLRLFARPYLLVDLSPSTWPLLDVHVNSILVRLPCPRGRGRRPAPRRYLRVDALLPGRIVGSVVTMNMAFTRHHNSVVYTLEDTGTRGTITHRSACRWFLYKGWELESGGRDDHTVRRG